VCVYVCNSMEQGSCEANSHSASVEILCLLWNLKAHYRVHKSPPLIPVLSQMHPIRIFPACFRRIQFTIIFPSTPRSADSSVSFRWFDQNFVRSSHLSLHTHTHTHMYILTALRNMKSKMHLYYVYIHEHRNT